MRAGWKYPTHWSFSTPLRNHRSVQTHLINPFVYVSTRFSEYRNNYVPWTFPMRTYYVPSKSKVKLAPFREIIGTINKHYDRNDMRGSKVFFETVIKIELKRRPVAIRLFRRGPRFWLKSIEWKRGKFRKLDQICDDTIAELVKSVYNLDCFGDTERGGLILILICTAVKKKVEHRNRKIIKGGW